MKLLSEVFKSVKKSNKKKKKKKPPKNPKNCQMVSELDVVGGL
jgi:murein endopeptidase